MKPPHCHCASVDCLVKDSTVISTEMAQCPCGLTRRELDVQNLVKNQRCTAIYEKNGAELVCGKLYTSHPETTAGKIPPMYSNDALVSTRCTL